VKARPNEAVQKELFEQIEVRRVLFRFGTRGLEFSANLSFTACQLRSIGLQIDSFLQLVRAGFRICFNRILSYRAQRYFGVQLSTNGAGRFVSRW
jgi:hypothetical protein